MIIFGREIDLLQLFSIFNGNKLNYRKLTLYFLAFFTAVSLKKLVFDPW